MNNLEQPKIDVEKINKAANEAAEKAYLDTIKSYYTGYDSPYKEMINTELEKQSFRHPLYLPDILVKLNQGLAAEVDKIANEAVANTFIPMVSEVLVRQEKELKMSNILSDIIEETFKDGDSDPYDYEFSYEKDSRYDWLNCSLRVNNHSYEITMYYDKESEKYYLLSMPNAHDNDHKYRNTMKLKRDDITIEMPFVANILSDKVMRIFCNIILASSRIEMDCNSFEDEMFPEQESEW